MYCVGQQNNITVVNENIVGFFSLAKYDPRADPLRPFINSISLRWAPLLISLFLSLPLSSDIYQRPDEKHRGQLVNG